MNVQGSYPGLNMQKHTGPLPWWNRIKQHTKQKHTKTMLRTKEIWRDFSQTKIENHVLMNQAVPYSYWYIVVPCVQMRLRMPCKAPIQENHTAAFQIAEPNVTTLGPNTRMHKKCCLSTHSFGQRLESTLETLSVLYVHFDSGHSAAKCFALNCACKSPGFRITSWFSNPSSRSPWKALDGSASVREWKKNIMWHRKNPKVKTCVILLPHLWPWPPLR